MQILQNRSCLLYTSISKRVTVRSSVRVRDVSGTKIRDAISVSYTHLPIISKEVAQCIFEARKGIANGDGTYSYRIQKLNGTYKDKNGNLSPYNCSKYKFLLDAPFKISHLCCHEMKKHPAYEYEALTGRIPLIATTTEESRARKSAWLKHGCNVFDAKRPLSAPFSFWTDNDILTYIHQENLPVADAYGKVVPELSLIHI